MTIEWPEAPKFSIAYQSTTTTVVGSITTNNHLYDWTPSIPIGTIFPWPHRQFNSPVAIGDQADLILGGTNGQTHYARLIVTAVTSNILFSVKALWQRGPLRSRDTATSATTPLTIDTQASWIALHVKTGQMWRGTSGSGGTGVDMPHATPAANLTGSFPIAPLEFTWTTARAYKINNTVTQTGVRYICIIAHTSGTFATDLAAGKWKATFTPAVGDIIDFYQGRPRDFPVNFPAWCMGDGTSTYYNFAQVSTDNHGSVDKYWLPSCFFMRQVQLYAGGPLNGQTFAVGLADASWHGALNDAKVAPGYGMFLAIAGDSAGNTGIQLPAGQAGYQTILIYFTPPTDGTYFSTTIKRVSEVDGIMPTAFPPSSQFTGSSFGGNPVGFKCIDKNNVLCETLTYSQTSTPFGSGVRTSTVPGRAYAFPGRASLGRIAQVESGQPFWNGRLYTGTNSPAVAWPGFV